MECDKCGSTNVKFISVFPKPKTECLDCHGLGKEEERTHFWRGIDLNEFITITPEAFGRPFGRPYTELPNTEEEL
jgi:hypothetical protein